MRRRYLAGLMLTALFLVGTGSLPLGLDRGVGGHLLAEDTNGEVSRAREELRSLQPPPRIFTVITRIIRPSVVSIVTTQSFDRQILIPFGEEPSPLEAPQDGTEDPEDPMFKMQGLGSGIITDRDGHILTNNHVVAGAEKISVYLWDETEHEATLVGVDPKTDLAVIKIDAPDLVPVVFADSDTLEVGESVLAFGAPFGLSQSVSAGIVSALGRSNIGVIRSPFSYEDFIQTDAAINRGNSGGPLVNCNGDVVGINTAIATGTGGHQGVGFAIAGNLARKVMTDLIRHKKVVRGYLGVQIRDISEQDLVELKLPDRKGVFVEKVYPDSPAEKAGLKSGDVVLLFNDRPTPDVKHLRELVAASEVGKSATLGARRGGESLTLNVNVQEQPELAPEVVASRWHDQELGLTVQTLTPLIAHTFTLDGDHGVYSGEKGVIVIDVDPDSPASRQDIKKYDLIKEVANEPVGDVQQYRNLRKNASLEKGVLLLVKSGRKARIAFVK